MMLRVRRSKYKLLLLTYEYDDNMKWRNTFGKGTICQKPAKMCFYKYKCIKVIGF